MEKNSMDNFLDQSNSGALRAMFSSQSKYMKKKIDELYFLEDEIFHYTDMDGLHGILKSRGFWLSEAKFLNDSEEIYHGLNLTKMLIGKLLEKARYKSFFSVLEATLVELKNNNFKNKYIASFSLEADNLEQWRAYAKNGAGVCIGFSTKGSGKYPHFSYSNLWKTHRVIYNDKQKLWILHLIIFTYYFEFKKDPQRESSNGLLEEEYAHFLAHSLTTVFINFKNKAFEAEREVRLVYDMGDPLNRFNEKHYRNVNNILVPYICTNDTKLKDRDGTKLEVDLLPLSKIIVGPVSNQKIIVESIQNFIEDIGYSDIIVELSKVPYRG
jgi:hypothetical protein